MDGFFSPSLFPQSSRRHPGFFFFFGRARGHFLRMSPFVMSFFSSTPPSASIRGTHSFPNPLSLLSSPLPRHCCRRRTLGFFSFFFFWVSVFYTNALFGITSDGSPLSLPFVRRRLVFFFFFLPINPPPPPGPSFHLSVPSLLSCLPCPW